MNGLWFIVDFDDYDDLDWWNTHSVEEDTFINYECRQVWFKVSVEGLELR